jgi:two-component system sensor histidine kinase EvgS
MNKMNPDRISNENLLKQTIKDLAIEISELKKKNEELNLSYKEAVHKAGERTKEIRALYKLSEIRDIEDITPEKLCQEIITFLPESWQYPEITGARIIINDEEFRTENFKESSWKQTSPVKINGSIVGKIEIVYLEERPNENEGPFLEEERLLLDNIAGRLGHIIERGKNDDELFNLKKAVDRSGEVFFTTDRDGIFTYINSGFTALYGYEAAEVIGKVTPRILKSGIYTPDVYKTFWDTLIEKKEIKADFKNKRKDGSLIDVEELSNAITDKNNNIIGFSGIQRDVSVRKRAEQEQEIKNDKSRRILLSVIEDQNRAKDELHKLNEELETRIEERTAQLEIAKAEAEQASQTKSEFLANMSHEIRTPMNAVLGYAELLSSTSIDKTQKSFIESIKSSGRGLLTLINDILDLSKIEAGKLELEFDYIHTSSFFSEFEKIFSLRVSEKGLKFVLDISPGTPGGLYVDETRLRQIIFNLIGNSIKFTETGFVGLKVFTQNPKTVVSKNNQADEYIDLVFEVEDTGIGISKKFQKEIFDPFTQEAGNRKYGGTGLGLSITRKLITMMNGTISLKSELSKGTVFRVSIPDVAYIRDFENKKIDIDLNPKEIIFDKANIVIADDVESNRKYLIDALKETNITIREAEDGETAYLLSKELRPDLIITDIRMPKLNGFELLDKLKNDEELNHIPVIAYSASVMKDQKEKIRNSEFAGLLIKPVQITELFLELMNHLPFKSGKITEPEFKSSEPVDVKEINDINGLLESLETNFMEIWKTFSERQPIGEIEEFGKNLVVLGNNHNATFISDYGNDMIGAASSFNIKAVLKLIKNYPVIIKELKDRAR